MFNRRLITFGRLMLQLLLRLILRLVMHSTPSADAATVSTTLELTQTASDLFQGLSFVIRLTEQMKRFYQLLALGKFQ